MPKVRARHAECCVVGCMNQHKSLHVLPPAEDVRTQWVRFIFDGKVPTRLPKLLLVCAHHFSHDSFFNFGQYTRGFASKLRLRDGSLPTIRISTSDEQRESGPSQPVGCGPELRLKEEGSAPTVKPEPVHTEVTPPKTGTSDSICQTLPPWRHIASQTDPPQRRSVGTQLSKQTLHNRFRSKATQATQKISSRDCGVCTIAFPMDRPLLLLQPTIVKRPSKRARLSLTDEEVPSPCSASSRIADHEPEDST